MLVRQLRNPLLLLLLAAALASVFVGERTDALIIFVISGLSVGLGFVQEFRAQRAVEALHSQLRYTTLALRDGADASVDVTELVPGDVVRIAVGDVVPADLRLLEADGLECDEAALTGESLPAAKRTDPVERPESSLDLPSCAFLGTVVRSGSGRGVVVQTGSRTAFGAIAVGLTPQLLPAIVTVSLSTGAKRLAKQSVIVKRLIAIEDIGNIDVLFTDKTGTLTEGRISFAAALDAAGDEAVEVLRLGLLCTDAIVRDGHVVGGPPLDEALWAAPAARTLDLTAVRLLATRPFDYERRLASVLVESADGRRTVIVKGAPELVFARCRTVSPDARAVLDDQFAKGSRVIAVATRSADGQTDLTTEDEHELVLAGFLSFNDPAKADAADALARLLALGVEVKVITGDNDRVAAKVSADLGLQLHGILTGPELDDLDEAALATALPHTTIFARVTPEQKSRVIKAQRALHGTVGFLGDGVNDAVALHDADVGISVQTATEVAKDAADIVLLAKDLDILADGVVEGRRIFANTVKYVLMGTSSNFGNVFSAGAASIFLSFLPLLPYQILLNNLLYDVSELTIPTDTVDEEQLRRPSHWDTQLIRRFMVFFGPISSLFDFATFAVVLLGFDAGATLFRSGWFVESLATQSLAIVVIRTRRVPFVRSRPSGPLLLSTLVVVAIGVALPFSPLAHELGFESLPLGLIVAISAIVPSYLLLLDLAKRRFYRREAARPTHSETGPSRARSIARRAARWSAPGLPRATRPAAPAGSR